MSSEQLETIKKDHEAMLAKTQNLQGQINGIDQQSQQMARKRLDLVEQLNQAATRAVELQGIIKYLSPEEGSDGKDKALLPVPTAVKAPAEAAEIPPAPAL